MNFDVTEEQAMLRDSVARFVQDDYGFAERRRIAAEERGMSRAHWQTFADLGWLSVPFSEDHGGFGGGPVDVMVMMEEFGKGLVLEPWFETVVLYGALLRHAASPAQQADRVPGIIDGSRLGAFAFLERQSRYALEDIGTRAQRRGGGWCLRGEKVVVVHGPNADELIVTARTGGEPCDEAGISLFAVPTDTPGLAMKPFALMDGRPAANVIFDDVVLDDAALLGEAGGGFDPMRRAIAEAIVALGAEALGIMATLNRKTLEYTRTREQFGVPIGTFQALQHRMVDTFMSCEQARSLVYRAVCALQETGKTPWREVHALKIMVENAGRHILGEAIQLHGGMGLTDEVDIGHYAKRLMMIIAMFGDGDYHRRCFAQVGYPPPEAA